MSRRIKMIWDFRGEDNKPIAEHHKIHLDQFIEKDGIENAVSGVEYVNDKHTIAFITVPEEFMIPVRDALIPHRGEIEG